MELPASTTGIPMTYMVNERQYIVVAIGGRGFPGELVALAVPSRGSIAFCRIRGVLIRKSAINSASFPAAPPS